MNPILGSKRNFDLGLPGYIVLEHLDMDPDPNCMFKHKDPYLRWLYSHVENYVYRLIGHI